MKNHGKKILFSSFTLKVNTIKSAGISWVIDQNSKDKNYTTRMERRDNRMARKYRESLIKRVMSKEL